MTQSRGDGDGRYDCIDSYHQRLQGSLLKGYGVEGVVQSALFLHRAQVGKERVSLDSHRKVTQNLSYLKAQSWSNGKVGAFPDIGVVEQRTVCTCTSTYNTTSGAQVSRIALRTFENEGIMYPVRNVDWSSGARGHRIYLLLDTY